MKRVTASDSTTIKLNGITFGIPKGTEISIAIGGKKGSQINTGMLQDGDGRAYPVKGITTPGLYGVVVHAADGDAFDFFNEGLFAVDSMPVVLAHGGESWTFEGFAVNSDENKSPSLKNSTEASEAFDIYSLGEQIR